MQKGLTMKALVTGAGKRLGREMALFPGKLGRIAQLRRKSVTPPVCPSCGRYIIGSSGCDCGKA